ncbi:MAG TPA: polymer-forming cytoskeletal protein [Longimicrobium sp.]|jgi:hypothetical protein|uniref:polymer-forming cytoskeletal protein n=1 Tax=Longimicrobium sp. TaxID=2029185 RepID=UPI002ED808EB
MRNPNHFLAGLALAAALAAPARAQDSLVLDAAPPPAPVAPLPVAAPAPVVRGDQLHFNGDQTIAAGQTVDGDVVLLNGDLTVAGTVRGDVTVARGDLVLERGAVIDGDAVVAGGRLVDRGARILGEMRVEDGSRAAALRGGPAAHARSQRSWFAPIGQGIAGIIQTLALGLVLAGIGVAMIFYGMPHLTRVTDTIRGETGRAAAVGVAAGVLSFPLFIVGIVLLCVTIIGIPLLLVYLPLFWLALSGAGLLGVVAVAHALGERTAEQRGGYDGRNSYNYLLTGLVVLLAPKLIGHLVGMTPFLGWIGDLIGFFAGLMLLVAGAVGMGAVLLVGARMWEERRYRKRMGWSGAGMDDLGTGGAHAL